jgi:2'-5' RNA ligase
MPRLFVAVWPPDDVLDRVAALPRPAIDGLRWTSRDRWHVTLRFLGAVDDVGPVSAALASVAAQPAPVARLGPAVGRFGHRVLHVPVAGVEGLAEAVVAATAHLGRPPEDRPFAGHLTLARVRPHGRVDLRPLAGTPVAGRWLVDAVCLVESRLSPAGAHYQVLERVALAG